MTELLKNRFILIYLLAATIVMMYGQFLWNPVVFDDIPFFLLDNFGNQPISKYRYLPFELRSLPYATLAWTKSIYGLDLIYFRIGNLILHAAVSISLFFFLELLFESALNRAPSNQLSHRHAAFFAALMFALHPVSTYAVGYLVQRTILMATLFCLLAMIAYVYGIVYRRPAWQWVSVLLYFLAVFSKEHAIMLPFALIALTMFLEVDWRVKLRAQWLQFAAYAAISACVILVMRGVLGSVYEPLVAEMMNGQLGKFAYPLSILTQSWLFFKYIVLWLLPNPSWMSIDMREPFAKSVISTYFFVFCIFLTWGVFAVWLLLKRRLIGLVGFAMIFPWLMFMTELATVRFQEIFVLYRSYLWAVGAFCLLPVLFSRIGKKLAAVILMMVAAAMFTISMERMVTMSQLLFLWDDAAKLVKGRDEVPGVYRVYYNRGTARIALGMLEPAIFDFKKVISLYPELPDGYQNLGVVYSGLNRKPEAIAAFLKSIEVAAGLRKEYMQAHGNLAIVYEKSDESEKAITEFGKAIAIARRQGVATGFPYYMARAEIYEKLGEFQKAQADYQEACTRAKKGCDKLTTARGSAVK